MKNIKLFITTILIIILCFSVINKYTHYKSSNNLKNDEKLLIKERIRVLRECFDLKNKNKRNINKSIELIEFCLKEYGK